MENEVQEDKIYRFIKPTNLNFIKKTLKKEILYLVGDLEIDPYTSFSLEFSAEYWYLKYHLLRDKKILLTNDDLILFREDNINIIFMSITDVKNFELICKDGAWYAKFFNTNEVCNKIYQKLKFSNFI